MTHESFETALTTSLDNLRPALTAALRSFFSAPPPAGVRFVTLEVHDSELTRGAFLVLHLHDPSGFPFDNGPQLLPDQPVMPARWFDPGEDDDDHVARLGQAHEALDDCIIDALLAAGVDDYPLAVVLQHHDSLHVFHAQSQTWVNEYSPEYNRLLGF